MPTTLPQKSDSRATSAHLIGFLSLMVVVAIIGSVAGVALVSIFKLPMFVWSHATKRQIFVRCE